MQGSLLTNKDGSLPLGRTTSLLSARRLSASSISQTSAIMLAAQCSHRGKERFRPEKDRDSRNNQQPISILEYRKEGDEGCGIPEPSPYTSTSEALVFP
jgi:hypothetical protein